MRQKAYYKWTPNSATGVTLRQTPEITQLTCQNVPFLNTCFVVFVQFIHSIDCVSFAKRESNKIKFSRGRIHTHKFLTARSTIVCEINNGCKVSENLASHGGCWCVQSKIYCELQFIFNRIDTVPTRVGVHSENKVKLVARTVGTFVLRFDFLKIFRLRTQVNLFFCSPSWYCCCSRA